jgi:cystathionine gamma-synthase
MTHQSVEDSAAAVHPHLVRLSCGIEDAQDLIEDLAQAI